MHISATIGAILQEKGAQVYSTTPEATAFEAIRIMADKNVGALAVLSGDRLIGMFSERDYTRKVALRGKSSKTVKVEDLYSRPVITASTTSTVEECMRLMVQHRIRHLPVMDGPKVAGVISMGDLVHWTISAQDTTISQLQDYIAGRYPS